jgi:hypothetical protein
MSPTCQVEGRDRGRRETIFILPTSATDLPRFSIEFLACGKEAILKWIWISLSVLLKTLFAPVHTVYNTV